MSEARVVPRWALALVAVALVLLLAYGVLLAQGRSRARAVERAWASDGRAIGDVLARPPRLEANEAALRLEAAAAKAGIDLAPREESSAARPQFPVSKAFTQYLNAELATEATVPGPAPPEVADWLRLHDADVHAIRSLVLEGDVPRWPMIPSRGAEAPIPNLLGHLQVQRVLLGAALEHARAGRTEEADAFLQAAFRLNESLWDRPELISQLIAGAAARSQLGALRRIDGLPIDWDTRLSKLDARGRMATALRLDSHAVLQLVRSPSAPALDGEVDGKPVMGAALHLYALLSGPGAADRIRQLVAVDAAAAPCVLGSAALEARLPPSGGFAAAVVTSLPNCITRAGLVDLHAEMTRHVLRARRERMSSTVPGTCPDWVFRTEALPDGSIHVRLDGTVPPDPSTGLRLPLRWGPDPPARTE